MWNLPGLRIEPVSPALAGGFLTTAPPGKSLSVTFLTSFPNKGLGTLRERIIKKQEELKDLGLEARTRVIILGVLGCLEDHLHSRCFAQSQP